MIDTKRWQRALYSKAKLETRLYNNNYRYTQREIISHFVRQCRGVNRMLNSHWVV